MTAEAGSHAPERLGAVGRHDDGSTVVRFEREACCSRWTAVWRAITDPDLPGFLVSGIRVRGGAGRPLHDPFRRTTAQGRRTWKARWSTYDRAQRPAVRHDSLGTRSRRTRAAGSRSRTCCSSRTGVPQTEIANAVLGGWHRYLDLLEQSLSGHAGSGHAGTGLCSRLDVPGRPGIGAMTRDGHSSIPTAITAKGCRWVRTGDGRIVEYSVTGSTRADARTVVAGYFAATRGACLVDGEPTTRSNVRMINVSLPGLGMSSLHPGTQGRRMARRPTWTRFSRRGAWRTSTSTASATGRSTPWRWRSTTARAECGRWGCACPTSGCHCRRNSACRMGQPRLPVTEEVERNTLEVRRCRVAIRPSHGAARGRG